MKVAVYQVAMDSPADTSRLEALVTSGTLDPRTIVACIGKTEGNGGANDFTRALATVSYQNMLAKYMSTEKVSQIAFVWSGGTEGVLSPHATFFTRDDSPLYDDNSDEGGSLAISVQVTPVLEPEDVGTAKMVEIVANAVREAMLDAGVENVDDVHYVQVKGPLLTPAGITAAQQRGSALVTTDPNLSKGYARGAMALGVALALGEVAVPVDGWNSVINQDLSLYSAVASTSAGGELTCCEVILMANTKKARGEYRIGHALLQDAVDAEGVREAMLRAGVEWKEPRDSRQDEVAAVFAKAEALAVLRGYRTTMYSDADIHYERHARAAVGAVIASVIGRSTIFVSGGTEHQCAPGAAPIAVIARRQQ